MTPDFEWIRKQFTGSEGDLCWRNYLVDPSGQVRADIDEPTGGRISFITELYWTSGEDKFSNWISLSIAKSHVEQAYRALINHNSQKQKRKQKRDNKTSQSRRSR